MKDLRYEISKDGTGVRATTDLSKKINEQIRQHLIAGGKIAEIDAELNGGALVEVARVLGKPLYIRVNHHDPEMAAHELKKVQSIVKSVVLGDV